MQTESWVGTIEREWHQLRRADLSLDVEKFFRHVVAANKTGFLSPESLAAIANALLTSALGGAPYLGRRLLERIGANRHPALRAASLADSARLGRGIGVDMNRARLLYERAIELGYKAAAHSLGLFWEGLWGDGDNRHTPDRAKAMQSYRRGGDDVNCQRRLEALR
jgi:hypothetical protein